MLYAKCSIHGTEEEWLFVRYQGPESIQLLALATTFLSLLLLSCYMHWEITFLYYSDRTYQSCYV